MIHAAKSAATVLGFILAPVLRFVVPIVVTFLVLSGSKDWAEKLLVWAEM